MSLVLWIAVFEHSLHALKCYVNDNFSVCLASDLDFYKKYEAFLLSNQACLLELWDEIGLPHEKEKQIWRAESQAGGALSTLSSVGK